MPRQFPVMQVSPVKNKLVCVPMFEHFVTSDGYIKKLCLVFTVNNYEH